MIATAMEAGSHFFEWTHQKIGGPSFPATVLLTRVELDGKTGVQATVRDITERKQAAAEIHQLNAGLEQRVRDRTAELEAADKGLEAFSYSVSHDLRAPLRAMDGFSMALLEDYAGKLDEVAQDHLRRIRAGSQKMAGLIDDLLNLSRLTRAEMQRDRVDLTAMAVGIGAELQRLHPNRAVELVVAPALTANADTAMVRVVLNNLLGNAWKFTGQRTGAKIEIGAVAAEVTRLTSPEQKSLLASAATVFFVRDKWCRV
jgi:signal transduction histidine kinase